MSFEKKSFQTYLSVQKGGRKPTYLTSVNIRINVFSVVPWSGRKQMSVGKIRMLGGLVPTHCFKQTPIGQKLSRINVISLKFRSQKSCRIFQILFLTFSASVSGDVTGSGPGIDKSGSGNKNSTQVSKNSTETTDLTDQFNPGVNILKLFSFVAKDEA
jgi:hypothetical protein